MKRKIELTDGLWLIAMVTVMMFTACKNDESNSTVNKDNPLYGKEYSLQFQPPIGSSQILGMDMGMDINAKMMGQEINTHMNMASKMKMEVREKQGNNMVIANSMETMSMDMEAMGMKQSFDSEDPEKTSAMFSSMSDIFSVMIGREMLVVMDPSGNIIDDSAIKQMLEALQDSLPGADESSLAQFKESMNNNMSNYTAVFPEGPVALGESWTITKDIKMQAYPMKVSNTYTITDRKDGISYLDVDGTLSFDGELNQGEQAVIMKINGSNKGTLQVEESTGWTKSAKIIMDMNLDMDAGGMKMPMHLIGDINIYEVK